MPQASKRGRHRGVYVDRSHVARERIADLLVEAAVLLKQDCKEADAWALLSMCLAVHRLAELDGDETIKDAAERLLHERAQERSEEGQ